MFCMNSTFFEEVNPSNLDRIRENLERGEGHLLRAHVDHNAAIGHVLNRVSFRSLDYFFAEKDERHIRWTIFPNGEPKYVACTREEAIPYAVGRGAGKVDTSSSYSCQVLRALRVEDHLVYTFGESLHREASFNYDSAIFSLDEESLHSALVRQLDWAAENLAKYESQRIREIGDFQRLGRSNSESGAAILGRMAEGILRYRNIERAPVEGYRCGEGSRRRKLC